MALLAAADLEANARQQGVQVVLEGESPTWVMGNGRLLQTVLEQLTANALDAMPQGGMITIRVGEEGMNGTLSVADTGPGLSAEAHIRLFEPFFTTKSGGHLGLGLAISKEIVEAQQGTIKLTSVGGEGMTVSLAFPLAEASLPEAREHDLSVQLQAPQPGYREPHITIYPAEARHALQP
jgi:two-component system sensor histidine kinase HydH